MQSSQPKKLVSVAGRNLLALAGAWLLLYVFTQITYRFLGGWPRVQIVQLLVTIAATAAAVKLGARIAAYFLASMVAVFGAELVIHAVFGIRAAQGGPTHLAVLAAAIAGVLAALLVTYCTSRTPRGVSGSR